MMRVLTSAFILFAGALLGWWLHGLQFSSRYEAQAAASMESAHPPARRAPDNEFVLPVVQEASRLNQTTDHVVDNDALLRRFRQLLDQHDFDQAIAFYESMLRQGTEYQALLRPELMSYSVECQKHCAQGVFLELADTWLASYYDDIPMLLELAEFQRQQGFYEDAANILNRAMTYAYTPNQREQVVRVLRQLVDSTDAYFSEQQRWIELLGFYEYLDVITLSEPAFRLRQAMIYRLLDETENAKKLLLALRASDDGLNPQWTQALDDQLEKVGLAAEPEPDIVATDAVPLSRRGDHYLIHAILNDTQQVVLMIDTGASVTSLSRSSFARLGSNHFYYLGSRVFNTANGLAKGEMYRADSIALGGNQIDDIDIAIFDYDAAEETDGLLGMNVLRNYSFEIDQEKDLLYLRPR
jgi:clan AA aspartic protease (TIGR02281 family)